MATAVSPGLSGDRLAPLAAIKASGLGIRDLSAGGRVVLAPGEPSQGLAFQAGEVIAMGKLLNRGYAISLADLAALVRNLDVATFGKAPVKRTNLVPWWAGRAP